MPPAQPRKPADVSAANKERNEYIPSFIAKKPFYVDDSQDSTADYLEHQRLQKSSSASDSKWYDRGQKQGPAATKYRKGACENCGAITHKTKDCLSRPRKAGARWTGKDIQADEVIQAVQLGWDAKRDRWNGYDPSEYNAVVEEYNELEEMKKHAKENDKMKRLEDGEEGDDDEGAKYEEETDMGRKQSTATRNLRIREDTAKYLLNLDLDSAKYDPKTRSMVDSGATADNAAALVAEEGFMRASGDAAEFEKAQRYAWETQERGDKHKIHLQANPTHGEYFRKKEEQEKKVKREMQRKALEEKYGKQTQSVPHSSATVIESERFIEYDERGKIKGAPETKVKSKYLEDIFINNHTSVWGSWWSNFKWGYACCHSTVKNSYCTGEEGKRAYGETNRLRTATDIDEVPKVLSWKEQEDTGEERTSSAVERDQKMKTNSNLRKRTLAEMTAGITEEEMEEYRRKKMDRNDPMAAYVGKGEPLR